MGTSVPWGNFSPGAKKQREKNNGSPQKHLFDGSIIEPPAESSLSCQPEMATASWASHHSNAHWWHLQPCIHFRALWDGCQVPHCRASCPGLNILEVSLLLLLFYELWLVLIDFITTVQTMKNAHKEVFPVAAQLWSMKLLQNNNKKKPR